VFDSTDVSTFAGERALIQRAVDEFGTIDALGLLAGRIPLTPLADVSEDEWDGVISSHLKGHFAAAVRNAFHRRAFPATRDAAAYSVALTGSTAGGA
jgi:NAD(P)-dependent dehydrogenase (short-subunit alcohol dehydrogenase family)